MANSPETEALRQDMDQLRKDFAALSDKLKHSYRDRADAGMSTARDRISGWCKEVEARPGTSIVSAFVIGMLCGKLISR